MMADKAKLITQSQALTAFVLSEIDKDPELGILLAQDPIGLTYRGNSTIFPFSNTALREAIQKYRLGLTFTEHDIPLNSVRYRP